jgi:hypothetical protein
VSIKKKFVTAVTTAGLLAGLFGSAFVPAARATDDAELTMAYGDALATDLKFAYMSTAAYPQFTVLVDPTHATNDNGVYGISVSGGTIRGCSAALTDNAAAGTPTAVVVTTTTECSAALTFTHASDDATLTVTLNKLSAGAVVTVTASDDDTDSITMTDALKLKAITAASMNTISKANTDSVEIGDATITVASLWTLEWDGTAAVKVNVKNIYDENPTVFPLVTATMTGPMSVALTTANTCGGVAAAAYGASSSAVSVDDTDNDVLVCVNATDGDSTSAGKGTLTISAGGVVVATQAINMIGQATSISATKGMNHFAVGASINSVATLYAAKLTFKDAAGNSLTAAAGLDSEVTFTVDGEDSADVEMGTTTVGYVDYTTLCTGYESGDKPAIVATYTNPDSVTDETATVAWSVTCTDADGKITNVKMAASSANPGSEVKVNLTVVDSEGLACGFGCTIPDATTVTRTPEGTDETDTLTIVTADAVLTETHFEGSDFEATLVDGTAWVKIQTPSTKGSYAAIIDYDDIETGGAVALEGSWTIRLVSSDVAAAPSSTGLTAGAKKLTATADFGATAGGAKIAFTLERSNGTVKTYYRKANADGVAKFTLRFRGTYEVTASYGDYITDTVILKK